MKDPTPTKSPIPTKSPGSFSTPSKIPRIKNSPLTKPFSTFAPVNLFSVSAVFSTTSSPTQEGYNFTFVHEGRQQEAVLDKTFLTGLEKDNVRITWEQATRELYCGQEVRVDVTQLKNKAFDQKWLVFGLYFYTIFCLGDPSAEFAGICPDSSCQHNSDVGGANSKENQLEEENPSSRTLRNKFQTEDSTVLLPDSPPVQEMKSSKNEGENGDVVLEDLENSSDASFSISFGSMSESESGESGDDFSMLANPDLTASHMEDVSVTDGVRLPYEGIYFDSLICESSIPTDALVIEAQFEKVLEENGLVENYNHFAAAFDKIFEESACNTKTLISTTLSDNTVLNTTNSSIVPELSPSSSPILASEASQYSEKEIAAGTGPALASTPAEKCGDGDHSLGFGLEETGISPVNMDSGYYETFSSGSLLEMSNDSEESSNPAEKTLTKSPGGFLRQFLFFSLEQIISELASIM